MLDIHVRLAEFAHQQFVSIAAKEMSAETGQPFLVPDRFLSAVRVILIFDQLFAFLRISLNMVSLLLRLSLILSQEPLLLAERNLLAIISLISNNRDNDLEQQEGAHDHRQGLDRQFRDHEDPARQLND